MPSYKVSNNNKPRMYVGYFCADNVVCSIYASLLLEVRQVCAFKIYLNIHLLNNYAYSIDIGVFIIIFNVIFKNNFTIHNMQ